MGVRTAFRRGIGSITDTPALLGVGVAYAVVATILAVPGLVGNPLLSALGTLGSLAFWVFGFPLFLGGLIGLAHAGLSGRDAGVGEFVESARDNYLYLVGFVTVLGAIEAAWTFVVGIVLYLVGIFVFVVVVFGGVFLAEPGAGGFTGASLAVIALGVLLLLAFVFLFYLLASLPALVVQFVPGSWVIEDEDLVDGLKRGVSLLGSNLKSVVAFDLSLVVLGIVASVAVFLPLAVVGVVAGPEAVVDASLGLPESTTGPGTGGPGADPAPGATTGSVTLTPLGIVVYALTILVVTPVQVAFLAGYYAAFYEELTGGASTAGTGAGTAGDRGSAAATATTTEDHRTGDAPR